MIAPNPGGLLCNPPGCPHLGYQIAPPASRCMARWSVLRLTPRIWAIPETVSRFASMAVFAWAIWAAVRGRQRTHHGQCCRRLGTGLRCGSGLCMNGRLPVVLPPVAGELFSSWMARHAAFYGVRSLTMLRHCLPEAFSLHIADRTLSRNQADRLAEMLSIDAKAVRRMTFANVQSSAHRFISKEAIQRCSCCNSDISDPRPILRSQLLGWRITCPLCSRSFQDWAQCDCGHPFEQNHAAALRGEKLLDNDAERDL